MLDTARVISMSTSRTSAGIAGTHSSPHSDEGIGRDAFPEANGRRTSSATSTVSGLARNRIVVGRRKEGELSGPEVAVVIPTRNRLEYLQPAVRSVVRQSVHELECLVVDDCSDDGTRQWLESVDDPRIRPIFLDRSRERSAARTLGSPLLVRPSCSSWTTTTYSREMGSRRASAQRVVSMAAMIVGRQVAFDETGHRMTERHPESRWPVDFYRATMLGPFTYVPGQVLLRTADVRSIGGLNEELRVVEDKTS